ncbi:RNA polymerase sigma factor [Thalassotalea sp. Y01]|uniref:RNA polymerase sigma factor n=1 Tax=Thalassotalea sp. Y01 TaxID=2729613 RepID=UPI00145CC629|nr:RNA polymerase sigma factor [Thalassotalea sp. Y01]NMP15067.1 RNA polymerase sigma factor [Thalassotalea sp. Y01]
MLKRLIAHFQSTQNRQTFDRIVTTCQSDLRGYCRRLTAGDCALADDIAQESLLIAYQQLGKLQNVNAFKSWLYRIAYRQYLQMLKARGEAQVIDEQTMLDEQSTELTEQLAQEQLIYRLMAPLSVAQRAVITMHLTLGYSHSEISELLHMPLGTVKSHCNRGKEAMQKHIPSCYKGVA